MSPSANMASEILDHCLHQTDIPGVLAVVRRATDVTTLAARRGISNRFRTSEVKVLHMENRVPKEVHCVMFQKGADDVESHNTTANALA